MIPIPASRPIASSDPVSTAGSKPARTPSATTWAGCSRTAVTPANPPSQDLPCSAWSKAGLSGTARSSRSGAIASARPSSMPRPSPAWSAAIRGLRTGCAGCSTWCSTTTWRACTPGTGRPTWPSSSTWHSSCSERPSRPSASKTDGSAPDGIQTASPPPFSRLPSVHSVPLAMHASTLDRHARLWLISAFAVVLLTLA